MSYINNFLFLKVKFISATSITASVVDLHKVTEISQINNNYYIKLIKCANQEKANYLNTHRFPRFTF